MLSRFFEPMLPRVFQERRKHEAERLADYHMNKAAEYRDAAAWAGIKAVNHTQLAAMYQARVQSAKHSLDMLENGPDNVGMDSPISTKA